MGIFLNPDNTNFQEAVNSKIYVDKTGIISELNQVIRTEQKYVCISRPRRFGKSMAANMLVAYYSRGCDSKELFKNYKIANDASFEQHLNRYNVIHINMTEFVKPGNIQETINYLHRILLHELKRENADIDCFDWNNLVLVLKTIFSEKRIPFIFIIDEWDCVFREHKDDETAQRDYLIFLRDLLKDQSYVAFTYMTGILPIKKYGEHSALNMFTEISMTDTREYAEFTGFTENEVKALCERFQMSYEETKRWYDGYNVNGISVYNPRSVVMSMTGGKFNNYWTSTETYEALRVYIAMDFDGLNQKITSMIAGDSVIINTSKFSNDMTTFRSADDVLTLLIHLRYLTYCPVNETGIGKVWIPNGEVQQEFINSIEDGGWEPVMKAIKSSEQLLYATIERNTETVSELIEQCHQDNTSILSYNDENSLSCVISLAYYAARKDYFMIRELPTGKGYADIVFLPRKNRDVPALVIELKWNQTADTAIQQIKQKQYTSSLTEYSGNILLVGINYDKKEKQHTCLIEEVQK